jgi:hypothetical protein
MLVASTPVNVESLGLQQLPDRARCSPRVPGCLRLRSNTIRVACEGVQPRGSVCAAPHRHVGELWHQSAPAASSIVVIQHNRA